METPPPLALRGTNFFRSPTRVAVLMFFADPVYVFWWLWQFFHFTKREAFPRARSFWWLLVPFYGSYVLYQQLDDLNKAVRAASSDTPNAHSQARNWSYIVPWAAAVVLWWSLVLLLNVLYFNNGTINRLLMLAPVPAVAYAERRSRKAERRTIPPILLAVLITVGTLLIIPILNPVLFIGLVWLLADLDSSARIPFAYSASVAAIILSVVLATAAYSTQRAANELLHTRYPEERFTRFSGGELWAMLLGVLLNAGYFYFQFNPVRPLSTSEMRVAPRGAPYTYQVPDGFHLIAFQPAPGDTSQFATALDSDKQSDARDVIVVSIYPLSASLEALPCSQIKAALDDSMSGLRSQARSFSARGCVKIGAMEALEYDYSGLATPNGLVDGVSYLLDKGPNELELDCMWAPQDRDEFLRGCEEVKRTLTFH